MPRKLFFTAFILNVFILVAAQETKVVRDLQLWTGLKVAKTFAKDWTISLEEEFRFKNNISQVNHYFTEAGLRYGINKNFSLGAAYRFTRDQKKDSSYVNQSRYHFDLRYKGKIDFLTLSYRVRYQKESGELEVFDASVPYARYFRNRLGIRMNSLKYIEPYATAEIFQVFTPYFSPEFYYYRIVAGVGIEPGNIGEFKLAWGFNREFSATNPAMIYMFRVNDTYAF